MKKKILNKNIVLLGCSICLVGLIIFIVLFINMAISSKEIYKYISNSNSINVNMCMKEDTSNCIDVARGLKVKLISNTSKDNKNLSLISYNEKEYLINKIYLVDEEKSVVKEKEMYVRTNLSLLESEDSLNILSLIKKSSKVEILGYNKLNSNGMIDMYKVKYNDIVGYVYAKYLVFTKEEADLNYDEESSYQIHLKRTNKYGGGSAGNLDFYPREKPKFDDNVMPEFVKSLYLNGTKAVISNIEFYIEYAKETNLNTLVIDIKDSGISAYESKVMQQFSPTSYKNAQNTFDDYQKAIKKAKEAGLYVVGRITTFKDIYYVQDHPESAISNPSDNSPLYLNKSYWPTPYDRNVWEYNIELAKEAVTQMGFNEIQFDYVRFPDRTYTLEYNKKIDFKNTYSEEKAQAIQTFLMYATDELHKLEVYVSADVFGESAHTYVTAYGQYWPAITNVVDVISGMPYPDHFSNNEYGFTTPPYKQPYKIMNYWGENYVMKRQQEVDTPAVVRTWIQAYNPIPGDFYYGNKQIEEQIKGLNDAGLTGGFMPWLSSSNLDRYKLFKDAFSKEY